MGSVCGESAVQRAIARCAKPLLDHIHTECIQAGGTGNNDSSKNNKYR